MAGERVLGPTIVADGVSKVIDTTTLLGPTDLHVEPGTCTVVRGRNGIGKTTLLRILAGTLDPTTGTATIDGAPLDERDAATRGRVAALLGAPAAYRDLTLADHLTLIDATWGRDADTCDERVDDGLESLGIGALAHRFPHELSSGQSQLFRLAMVLFRPSDLLILDEPEQRLDPTKRALVSELLIRRRDAGSTLAIASHDPEMTRRIADAVVDLPEQ